MPKKFTKIFKRFFWLRKNLLRKKNLAGNFFFGGKEVWRKNKFWRQKIGGKISVSNYLFLLDEGLQQRGNFGYHPRCKNMKLTNLCFADDIMVFSDGKITLMEGILKVFNEFAVASGLNIILEKSTLFLTCVSNPTREEILTYFLLKLDPYLFATWGYPC
ncbi:Hypothetical Protein [Arabidopsis thaliana]|uniref:F13F21.12 protein n=1 Tax=Arabidopsis thaliana TaxID=3702 RepID=Q9XIB1_ARATH|nr:Hypothetical Protein [Arabidopsis thaliana]